MGCATRVDPRPQDHLDLRSREAGGGQDTLVDVSESRGGERLGDHPHGYGVDGVTRDQLTPGLSKMTRCDRATTAGGRDAFQVVQFDEQ